MYEVLIAHLRECAKLDPSNNTYTEAADAIEELSEYVNTIRKLKCEGWQLKQIKFHDGYQAVSIMALPEPPKGEEK